jgi:hypothetical protein
MVGTAMQFGVVVDRLRGLVPAELGASILGTRVGATAGIAAAVLALWFAHNYAEARREESSGEGAVTRIIDAVGEMWADAQSLTYQIIGFVSTVFIIFNYRAIADAVALFFQFDPVLWADFAFVGGLAYFDYNLGLALLLGLAAGIVAATAGRWASAD